MRDLLIQTFKPQVYAMQKMGISTKLVIKLQRDKYTRVWAESSAFFVPEFLMPKRFPLTPDITVELDG